MYSTQSSTQKKQTRKAQKYLVFDEKVFDKNLIYSANKSTLYLVHVHVNVHTSA